MWTYCPGKFYYFRFDFNLLLFKGSLPQRNRSLMNHEANNWLKKRKVKSFYNLATEDSFLSGVRSMIQVTKHDFLK